MVRNTQSLLSESIEDRIRPQKGSGYFKRGGSGSPRRNQVRSAEGRVEGRLDSSYDSILSKLGTLQEQIVLIKQNRASARKEEPLLRSFNKTAELRSTAKRNTKASMKGSPEIEERPRSKATRSKGREVLRQERPLRASKTFLSKNINSSSNNSNPLRARSASKKKLPQKELQKKIMSVNRTFYGKENLLEMRKRPGGGSSGVN